MKNKKQYSDDLFNNGFVHVKSLLNSEELKLLNNAINSSANNPSPFARKMKSDKGGEFFTDFNNWRKLPLIKEICFLPKLVNLVTEITNSKKCWLFHDHVLVKHKNASATPVHQDRPYYIFKGNLNLSVWLSATDVPSNSGLIFYKQSHKLNKLLVPKSFVDGLDIKGEKIPEGFESITEDLVKKYEEVSFDMKAGDGIVFFNNTLHCSHPHNSENVRKALSVRYLLDGSSLTKKYINATPPFDKMGVKVVEDDPVPEKFFPLIKG